MSKHLIIYSYFEKLDSKENLNFFIKNGIFEHEDYQFLIVVNGENFGIDLPEYKNVKLLYRENKGFDFGGWGFGLKNTNIRVYDYFIFLNSTCVGPFLPRYIPQELYWTDLFVSKIDNDIKLCGPTINYLPTNPNRSKHIQSYAFGTDIIGLELLIKNGIFDPDENINRKNVIENHELGMSDVLLSNNFKIYSFQLSENLNSKIEDKSKLHGDIHYVGKYYEDTINPIEVMFLKTQRIKNKTLENYIFFYS